MKFFFSSVPAILLIFLFFQANLQSQWTKQNAPVTDLLSCIKFINPNTGWACSTTDIGNDTSFILKTTDGGANWSKQFFGIGYLMRTVSAIDGNVAYVGGITISMNPLLLKTTNGGINWINKAPPSGPYDIWFANENSGWYCSISSSSDIRTTTDGGITWQQRSSGLSATIYKLSFLNYNTGWCGGSNSVYKTTNAGINWVQIGIFNSTVSSVFFNNQNYGWAGLANGKVVYTSNGGTNWIYQSTPVEGVTYGITDLCFFDNLRGFAGSRSIKILKTYNGGQTWGYQIDSGYSERMSFVDSLNGWTVFWHIRKTTNGGGQVYYTSFVPSQNSNTPSSFKLYQNFPNPFNPGTTIKVDLVKTSSVKFFIYDIIGKVVLEIKEQALTPGSYEFNWDASGFSSGIYFYRIITDNFSDTKKMVLCK